MDSGKCGIFQSERATRSTMISFLSPQTITPTDWPKMDRDSPRIHLDELSSLPEGIFIADAATIQ